METLSLVLNGKTLFGETSVKKPSVVRWENEVKVREIFFFLMFKEAEPKLSFKLAAKKLREIKCCRNLAETAAKSKR